MDNDQFIAGIHNYCDRWCERCDFTDRCRVYASEALLSKEQQDMSKEAFWQYLDQRLQQALDLLEQQMEEMGIDWEEPNTVSGEKKADPNEKLLPEQSHLHKLSHAYHVEARRWFEARQGLFQEKEESLKRQLEMGMPVMPEALRLTDALEVINWYSFFIGSKLHRALNGLNDSRIWEEEPIQNDANGSAKITLIAIERSLAAWEVIRLTFPDASDELLEFFILLGKMRSGIMEYFPRVHSFIRPGFDEPKRKKRQNEGSEK